MRDARVLLLALATVLVLLAARACEDAWVASKKPPQSAIGTVGRMGLFVEQVLPDSPAERAGILPGDVIFSLGEVPIDSDSRFREVLGKQMAGSLLDVHLLRYDAIASGWEAKRLTVETVHPDELPSP